MVAGIPAILKSNDFSPSSALALRNRQPKLHDKQTGCLSEMLPVYFSRLKFVIFSKNY